MVSEENISNKSDVENVPPPPSPIGLPPPISSSSRQSSRVSASRQSSKVDPKPSIPVCPFANEKHVGKEIISCLIDCPPQKIYTLLFLDAEFMHKVYTEHKYSDVSTSTWEADGITGNLKRKVTFTAALPSNVLGPSSCGVTEIQTSSNQNRENELYVVNKESVNSGIPYADSFKIYTHYCITKVITDTSAGGNVSSRFSFFCNVSFKKGTLFFVKNLIEKNAVNGCETVGNTILSSLMREIKGEGGTVPIRRRRKGVSKINIPPPMKTSGKCAALVTLWLILMLLLAAGVANVYLYTRLNHIEASTYRDWIWRRQLSLSPSDAISEELDKILAEGEDFYASQVSLWEEELIDIINALDKIEQSLKQILESVPQMKKHAQILAGFRKNIDAKALPLQNHNMKTLYSKFAPAEL